MRLLCFLCILLLLFGDTTRHADAIKRRQRKNRKRGRRFENIVDSTETESEQQQQDTADSEPPAVGYAKINEETNNAGTDARGGRGRRRRRIQMTKRESRRRIRSNSSTPESQNQTLIWKWKSIKGTLFNHFMQVKYIYSVAQQYNRSLVIVGTTGRASDAKDTTFLSLCDAFDFSGYNIVCTDDPKVVPLKCFEKFEVLDRFSGMTRLCYDGRIWYIVGHSFLIFSNDIYCLFSFYYHRPTTLGVVPPEQSLQVMTYTPRLQFNQKYLNLYEMAMKSYLTAHSLPSEENVFNLTQRSFAVVDWRAGDYCRKTRATATIVADDDKDSSKKSTKKKSTKIESSSESEAEDGQGEDKDRPRQRQRLRSGKSKRSRMTRRRRRRLLERKRDKESAESISCATSAGFSLDVRAYLQAYLKGQKLKAIGTPDMKLLLTGSSQNRTDVGVLNLKENNMDVVANVVATSSLKPAEVLLVEALFMLHAPLLLSYGSHASSDLIESERMLMGRSFCARAEVAVSPKQPPSWCQLYQGAQREAAAAALKAKRSSRNSLFFKGNRTADVDPDSNKDSQQKDQRKDVPKSWKSLWGLLSLR